MYPRSSSNCSTGSSSATVLKWPLFAWWASRLVKRSLRLARTQSEHVRALPVSVSSPIRSWTAWAWGIRYLPMATARATVSVGICAFHAPDRCGLLSEVQQGGDPDDGAGQLPAPVPHRRQLAVRPEPGLYPRREVVEGSRASSDRAP